MDKQIMLCERYIPCLLFNELSKYDTVNEIHLRADRPSTVTQNGRNVLLEYNCTKTELYNIFKSFCRDSVYAQSENIKRGCIISAEGLRIGVCGTAFMSEGKLKNISTVDALNIRIPHFIMSAGTSLYQYFESRKSMCGILLCSPPGMGKTTVLKDFARLVSSGEHAKRTVLIDEKCELYDKKYHSGCLIDCFSAYPKSLGIELAVKNMAPQLIICDEIGSYDDADILLSVQNSGVPIVASAHGGSLNQIKNKPNIRKLLDNGIFDCVALLDSQTGKINFYEYGAGL